MKNRLVHLDFLRGLAALLVVLEHLWAFFFVTFPELQSPGILAKAFYFFTGLGHQSVMIFFVFFHGKQIVPNAVTSLCFVGLLSVTIAYSMGIWWHFERNTDEVRVFVESKIRLLTVASPSLPDSGGLG